MAGLDVLIVTALRSEYEAALSVGLAGYNNHPGVATWEEQGRDTPTPHTIGDYLLADGHRLTVALARPTRMGGTATSPVVSSLVAQLRPSCLAMCGVCAGNPKEVALGDVIVAELAYAYDEGQRSGDSFVGDHRQIPLSDAWVRTAQDMSVRDLQTFGVASEREATKWILQRLYEGDDPRTHLARPRYFPEGNRWAQHVTTLQSDGLVKRTGRILSLTSDGYSYVEDILFDDVAEPAKLPFAVAVKPLASGNVVVRDGLTWDHLAQLGVRSVGGLDMEAATIAQTAHRLSVPEWVVVKGVMDYADPRKNDRYKAFAERASAEVLFKLLVLQLRSQILLETRTTRVRSVYVIGGVTEETEYPDFEQAELADFCRRLGSTVATAGADLVLCSPFPESADFHALMGYVQCGAGNAVHLHRPRHPRVEAKEAELRAMLGPVAAQQIKTWHYPGPELGDSDSWGQAWLLCQLRALDQADVVISIGGRVSKTANTILHLAQARGKPVVPFEFLGGASRRVFNRRDWARAYPGLDFQKLKNKNAAADAMLIADHIVTADMRVNAHTRVSQGYEWPPRNVFISRARPDVEFAQALDDYLTKSGFNVLLGERGLPPDMTVETAIENAVLGADLFIALWSKSFALSPFCYDEIELALRRHEAGELQLWLINLDSSAVIPPAARNLPQAVASTPYSLVELVRDLLVAPSDNVRGVGTGNVT